MLFVVTVSCCSVFSEGDYKCVKITFGTPETELISLSDFFFFFLGWGHLCFNSGYEKIK